MTPAAKRSAADLGRVRAALLASRDVITPDEQTRHALARLVARERDLLAVEALLATVATSRDGDVP